ncbi:MAG: glycosyltransferase [Synechococcales cyanobacterium M58_A2018_015]|nr:glycosyltransferase [Synechococcales cyanobacterium M58_A2018_015]
MIKHYLFFTRTVLPQPRADLIQIINGANAAANLGYSAVLTYLDRHFNGLNLHHWVTPFHPQPPDPALAAFYHLQQRLKVAALPIPWRLNRIASKWTHPSTLVCKYYFPLYIRPATQIVHTRDWNFVKAAIRSGIPAIYEHDHYAEKPFEPEIVHHPLFQATVTVAEPIRASLIQQGMPPDKILQLHNGFNQQFLIRHPQQSEEWRRQLLAQGHRHLAVYSGALYAFKGVDLLIEVARDLPQVQFVFAGGSAEQVAVYQQLCRDKQVSNAQFLGHLPHEQLASLLQAADVLVHPHLMGEAATFTSPMKFFDYMASGTPIVATEIPPLQEFKAAGVVAGWCEPNQPHALAACIQHVLDTRPRQSQGYTHSMDFVQQFSWENRITQIMKVVAESCRPVLLV